jgi:hypothetical protein
MDDTSTPRSAHAAHDDLRYIRQTLAAAGHISTVPGKGLIVVGGLALLAMLLDLRETDWVLFQTQTWGGSFQEHARLDGRGETLVGINQQSAVLWSIALWGGLLFLSLLVGAAAMRRKAKRMGQGVWTPILRKALWGYIAAMGLGGVLTAGAVMSGRRDILPEIWLGCYGVGLVSAGAFSVSPVRWMGLCFLLLAAGASVTHEVWGPAYLALGFGWVHIAFGAYIAWRHDG